MAAAFVCLFLAAMTSPSPLALVFLGGFAGFIYAEVR